MDVEKLIERLKEPDCDECTYEEKRECAGSAKCVLSGYAAEALSTLQAENEKLRAELEQVKEERDVAVEYLRGQCRYCKRHLACTSRKGPHSNCWEWRGQKEE